jgi:acyl carrier protein
MEKDNLKNIEKELVREVAAILGEEESIIDADAELNTFGIDSFSFVELLVVIEEKFSVKLMESGMTREDFRTIHSLAECISRMGPDR